MNSDDSYIERCIRALPPERQGPARQAYKEVDEDGTGTFLGKLLVLLDASGAYAKTIPYELKCVADSLIREIEGIRSRDALQRSDEAQQCEKQLRQILADQMPVLAKGLAVTRLAEGLEAQNTMLGRLEYAVSAMRYFRVAGLLLLMGLATIIGAAAMGAFFYKPYQEGQQSKAWLDYFSSRGIGIHARETQNMVIITVDGRGALLPGTDYRKDDQGRIMGVELIYPK